MRTGEKSAATLRYVMDSAGERAAKSQAVVGVDF